MKMMLVPFNEVVAWVAAHGYALIFFAMLIEGPLITAAAGFAAALGQLSFPIILVLSFFGDLVGDVIYYGIGYLGRNRLIEKYGHYVGIHPERMLQIERYLERHAIKGLFIAKWLPALPTIVLLSAGVIKMRFRKFLVTVTLATIPRTLLFSSLGYYFGEAYTTVSKYIENTAYLILIFGAALFGAYYLYRKFTRRLATHVEIEEEKPANEDSDFFR